MPYKCCVELCGNTNREIKMHVFPLNDSEVYNIWLKRIGRKDLFGLKPATVHKNYRICDQHFSPYSHVPDGASSRSNLKKRSLPTLHLPAFNEIPSEENSRLFGAPLEEKCQVVEECLPCFSIDDSSEVIVSENLIHSNAPQLLELSSEQQPEEDNYIKFIKANPTSEVLKEVVENLKLSLCRICGEKNNDVRPIFNSDPLDENSLSVKMNTYLPYKVHEDDLMPVVICSKCANVLHEWHELNVSCLSANIVLKRIFSNMIGKQIAEKRAADDWIRMFESTEDDNSWENFDNCFFDLSDSRSLETCQLLQSSHRFNSHQYAEKYQSSLLLQSLPPDLPLQNQTTVNEGNQNLSQIVESTCRPQFKNHIVQSGLNEEIHPRAVPYCRYCCRPFISPRYHKKHLVECREVPDICELCGTKVLRREFMRRHLAKHLVGEKIKSFMCDKCSSIFRCSKSLKNHLMIKHAEEAPVPEYFCECCCQVFLDKVAYNNHVRNHEDPVTPRFKFNATCLEGHEISYSCPVCSSFFDNKLSLVTHLCSKTTVKCVKCLKLLHSERSFLLHNCKNYECPYCHKSYRDKQLLAAHIRLHTGEKPYKCPYCSARFRSLSVKIKHIATHKPPSHKCTYCNKEFRVKSLFREHVNVHEEKIVSCSKCGKQFGGIIALNKHNYRTHNRDSSTNVKKKNLKKGS